MGKQPEIVNGRHTKVLALDLAVLAAMTRREDPTRRCPHAFRSISLPLLVALGEGMIACRACAPRFAASAPVDDGHCDICDQPSEIFIEFWIELGPCVVHGGACAECNRWMSETQKG